MGRIAAMGARLADPSLAMFCLCLLGMDINAPLFPQSGPGPVTISFSLIVILTSAARSRPETLAELGSQFIQSLLQTSNVETNSERIAVCEPILIISSYGQPLAGEYEATAPAEDLPSYPLRQGSI